jgi:hypothetical protein
MHTVSEIESLARRRVVAVLAKRGVRAAVAERMVSEMERIATTHGAELDDFEVARIADGLMAGAIKQLGWERANEMFFGA